ncbi:MAG: hypothetical protein H7257_03430 [Taibaiella sp.]|nr:hypothetical protein [Taibaiella sp.]
MKGIAILLYVIPFIIIGIKCSLFTSFSAKRLMAALNINFVIVAAITLLLILCCIIMDNAIYNRGIGNTYTDVFMETSYAYIVISLMFVLPGGVLLNFPAFWRRVVIWLK